MAFESISETIEIRGQAVPVWPEGQRRLSRDQAGTIYRTVFSDSALYHEALTAHVLAVAAEPKNAAQYSRSLGGTKLYNVEHWELPEARLISARAQAFFRRALGREQAAIDIGWANVYGRGDYIMPHSHTRAFASLVYCLEPGDEDPEDDNAGRFCFVDPRFADCCQIEPGRMTNPLKPSFAPGTMLMFPGEMVHFVGPYNGDRPRITIAWNINAEAIEGSPLEPFLNRQQEPAI